jgi:hypothetical protein
MNNFNQFHPVNNLGNFEHPNSMMKAQYEMYYSNGYMDNFRNGYPIDNEIFYRMNSSKR